MLRDRKCSSQTLLLLASLMQRPVTWRHGYDLSGETGLQSGTLYPILLRLTDRKLLESMWRPPEQVGRPARHVYRLTTAGIAYAREQLRARVPQARLAAARG